MFGWLKLLCRKFSRLHPIVQLVVVVLLFIAARWTYRTVLYSSFTGKYLEGFGNGSTLTYFHMEGCPHCVKFTPEWDKFAQEYDGSLQIKKVEAKEMSTQEKSLGIQGFPTIMVVDGNGKKEADYDGPRTAEGLKAFAS